MVRCFVAVEVSENILEKLVRIQTELPAGVKKVEKENLHITLLFLGEIGDKEVDEAKEVIESIRTDFAMKVSGAGAFPTPRNPRVVWVGAQAEELKQLNSLLCEKLGAKDERFHAHITIGRVKEQADLQEFLRKHEKDDFGGCEVKKIYLKKSTLTQQGPIYENVAESE